ncbi:hypothetical protein QYE76_026283, partial [Lolium multiflorum]
AIMVIEMSESVVMRYLKHAIIDMYENNRKLQGHLLTNGFMHGHTQWMSDDDAEVNGATATGGNGRQEGGHHDIDEDEEFVAQDDNLDDDNNLDDDEEVPLASGVRDPHLQDLLLEKTKGAKRKSKLEQLEIDSNTPLYDSGRGLGESRESSARCAADEGETRMDGHKRVPCARKDSSKAWREEEKGNDAAHWCMEKEVRVLGLVYWKILDTPHCLDVIHITKNVCESLLGTLLNMPDRTKDGPKARHDLKVLGIREELQIPAAQEGQSEEEADGGQKRKRIKQPDYYCPPPASLLVRLSTINFQLPSRSQSALRLLRANSRYMDLKKRNFSGMKSHDCHVMMTQILPVAIRGIMDYHVRATLTGLCNFFDVITRKSISVKKLARLQEEIVVILCELEMYFPHAFFDVMVHMLVHIMDDIINLGPTFLQNMMSFERMNGVIKGYVRNRSHPDGSIVQGWLTEECISFCTNYLDIEDHVGLPQNKHLRGFEGVGHKNGRKELHVHMSGRTSDFDRANLVALQHIDLIDPWLKEHKTMIENSGKPMTEAEIFREHNSSFARWFKDHIDANPPPMDSDKDKLVLALSHGPAPNIMTYQAYDINGYTFYTEEKDKNIVYQNSGVTMDSWTGDVKTRYYGRIEEIWELSYAGEKVPMFRIRWAKSVTKEDRYFTTMFLPEANKSKSTNATAQNEPWVLAEHVHQCFFITDPSRPSRVIVRRGKRTIVGMDGVANEEDFEGQVGDPMMEESEDEDTTYTTRRSRTTLPSCHHRPHNLPPPTSPSTSPHLPHTRRRVEALDQEDPYVVAAVGDGDVGTTAVGVGDISAAAVGVGDVSTVRFGSLSPSLFPSLSPSPCPLWFSSNKEILFNEILQ